VSYINVRHVKATKALPDRFLDLRLRSVPQQAPAGRLHINMELPRASNESQEEMTCMVKKNANVSMSLLVLEKDLAAFMKVLRMNDLAYCHRKLTETLIHDGLHAIRGVHGIKSEIIVSPGQQLQHYEHLILEFRVMNNPLHKTVVVGHADKDFAEKSVDLVQGQLHERARKALGLSKAKMNDRLSMETHGEAVSSLLWLKHRGDEYLAKGLYSNAYMCYSSACTLEKHCLAMSPPPPNFNFWTTQSCLYVTFGVTLVYNMAIAKMKGGLDLIPPQFRGTSIRGFYHVLAIISNGGTLLDNQRLAELSMVAMIYEMLTENFDKGHRLFDIVTELWEENDIMLHLPSNVPLLCQTVKRLDDADYTPASCSGSLDELKTAAASSFANIAPLKWSVTENHFPIPMRELVQFLPQAHFLPGGVVQNHSGYSFEIPVYGQPTDEQHVNGEERLRYLV
jgi:hypothetical protein